jgi:hypothetical protein
MKRLLTLFHALGPLAPAALPMAQSIPRDVLLDLKRDRNEILAEGRDPR